MFRTFSLTLAALAAVGFGGALAPVNAGGYGGGGGHGPTCHPGHGSTITINKPVNIWKSININNSVHINKRITINKPVNIHKSIIINKGGSSSAAVAIAAAAASSRSDSAAIAVASGGSSVVDVEAPRGGGDFGEVSAELPCVEQWATVVKAIHAECIDRSGTHHPATRMRPETWLDSSTNAEIYRCLEGSHLHVQIGDVVQSDQGMVGAFGGGQVVECAAGEALRHFRDGALRCAKQVRVPDCTERSNMRAYGTGDVFFSYRNKVCAQVSASAGTAAPAAASGGATYSQATGEVQVSGSFNGGVGD